MGAGAVISLHMVSQVLLSCCIWCCGCCHCAMHGVVGTVVVPCWCCSCHHYAAFGVAVAVITLHMVLWLQLPCHMGVVIMVVAPHGCCRCYWKDCYC